LSANPAHRWRTKTDTDTKLPIGKKVKDEVLAGFPGRVRLIPPILAQKTPCTTCVRAESVSL
jgi:hypothetical protein